MIPRALLALALASSLAAAGCANPVNDDLVASLGGEDPAVPAGPLHRPGQPCLACHGGQGPAQAQFATAGTVFQDSMNVFPNAIPMAGATVTLQDACAYLSDPGNCEWASQGVVTVVETNCAGNFYVAYDDWTSVVFPIHTQVSWGSQMVQMMSHMGKESSCATCHVYAVPGAAGAPAMAPPASSPDSVGQIYLSVVPQSPPPPSCP